MDPAGGITRRTLATRGAVVVGGGLTLAACGADDTTTPAASPASSSSSSPAGSSSSTSAAAGGSGAALAQLSDVPVGSAVKVEAADGTGVIVVQPTAGTAVAFDARCPHAGCAVAVKDTELDCPCHGSRFDALTGKVLKGPATQGLAPYAVTVTDGAVVAAT